MTAKDQYGNLVKGEQLYTDVTIINNDGETDEEYIVAGYVYKESDKNVEFVVPTNENGKTSMKVRIPSHVDENDGISIQFKTDGGTKAGSAVGFIAGSIPPVNTTVQVSPSLSSGKTSIVTIIARDEKGRAIKNHQFYADIIIINHDKTNNESYTVSDHVYRASNTNVKVGRKTDANGITTFQITIPNVVDKNDGISIQLKTDINGYAIGEPIKFIESSSGGGSGGGGSGSGGSGGSGGGSGSVSQNNNKINVTKEMVKNASGETLTVTISSSAKEPAVYVNGDALKELISQRKSLAVKTNDVAITIPSSAVASIDDDQQAKITVKELDSKEAEDKLKDASKNAGKGLFAIGGRVFEFTAEIEDKKGDKETLRFNSDITVAISLAGMDLSTINVEKLGVYYYNESTEEWEYVGGVYNPKTNTITFTTSHFSLYAVMEYNKTFADIASHWAKNEIEIIAAKHIMVGVDDTHFEPDRSITRAEFAAILARTLKLEPDQASVQFVDVPEGKWYYDYISAATKAGLIKGVDSNHFAPDANITREQMATMITRAYTYLYGGIGLPDIPNANDGNLSIFTDRSNISGYARASISFVINEKLVDGRTQTTFEPKANATRAEVAVALYRFIKLMERK